MACVLATQEIQASSRGLHWSLFVSQANSVVSFPVSLQGSFTAAAAA